ncbi:MAG TPA: hypothetical protein PLB52_02885 [Candidatus Moranbacteria bacterium]|nr:hypothetical protein [Candidatus Moranbacteria bacterium]
MNAKNQIGNKTPIVNAIQNELAYNPTRQIATKRIAHPAKTRRIILTMTGRTTLLNHAIDPTV